MTVAALVASITLQRVPGEGEGRPHSLVPDFGCTAQSPGELWRNTDATLCPQSISFLCPGLVIYFDSFPGLTLMCSWG